MCKKVPELEVATEREGHLHAFCCTKAGSDWVARYAADTIFNHTRGGPSKSPRDSVHLYKI